MGFFSTSRPTAPAPAATDTVIPFHTLDGHAVVQAMVLEFAYRFDDALEYERLRNSLERLLEIGDWRKLGARIRKKVSSAVTCQVFASLIYPQGKNRFEYHLPKHYTEERPGVYFSNTRHATRINDHPVASRMPRAVAVPTIFGSPDEFKPVIHGPDHPQNIDDWLHSDRPPLSVHVGSFHDATLLTLTFSHMVLDACGVAELMTAWLCVLEGREEEIKPFLGFAEDPLQKAVGRVPKEKHMFYDQVAGPLGLANFVVGVLLELLRYPQEETRTICIPDRYVRVLKAEAKNDLKALSAEKGEDIFVSDSDVLFAWWAKLTIACQRPRLSRPVRLGNIFTWRGVIDDVLPPDTAYVGNAISCAYMTTTVKEVLARPLGRLALDLRNMLARQRNKEQIFASLSLLFEFIAKGKFMIFVPGNALRLTWSNW
jgi:hypothetical protein